MKKILVVLNLLTLMCFAAPELYTGNEELKLANNSILMPGYFKMFFGLALVIGLIYATGIIYQKLIKVKISDMPEDKYKPEIISTTPLGQNKNLHVIKVMGEYLLVGSTQTNISFLKNLKEAEDKTEL